MADSNYDGISIREFLVDLLACLVPGFLFLFLAFATLIWPAWSLIREIQTSTPLSPDFLQKVKDFAEAFRFELVGFLLFGSYVLGHLLYRQDPKVPDQYSCERAIKKFKPEEKKYWVVQELPTAEVPLRARKMSFTEALLRIFNGVLKMLRIRKEESTFDIQFPYLYLHEYLISRKLSHLADLVPWQGNNEGTYDKRSKAFINILKIRLMFYCPDKCGQITRNEAHVRLMSSVWYAGKALCKAALIGIGVGFIAAIWGLWNPEKLSFTRYLIPILPCIPVILISIWIMRTIEKFLHYQRVREIIFVLETVYNAMQKREKIMAGLSEKAAGASGS